jgi:hypothetical protein
MDGWRARKDIGSVAVRWVSWFYLPLILLVIGACSCTTPSSGAPRPRPGAPMQNPMMCA